MNPGRLEELLLGVREGRVSVGAALGELRRLPYVETLEARVDHHRELRMGVPEVVLGSGKTASQIAEVAAALRRAEQRVLVTRVPSDVAQAVLEAEPGLVYHDLARCLTSPMPSGREAARPRLAGPVAIVTGGTSDVPVAEEAALTLEHAGERVERLFDVGVAGLHRLLAVLPVLERSSVVIAIAGMEGALPSVVGGLVGVPVIAVPTSVGYGVAAGGTTALHAMLTSCASGIAVVNIDNGFGAAMAALRLALAMERGREAGSTR